MHGDGYETGQVPLFHILVRIFGHKLISNKLVEAFDWLSCRKKRVVGFCAGSCQKSEQKH